ncbi:polyketide synthase dehydratase domain-containing protein, partial [Streptomyces sulfonofaciens]|uniref:polyketide synthase dehydratase domain-containing protein n=1 Tax=Streptomyces sulfonofaciens TaxID=68272 RepID=UPI0016787487
SGWFPHTPATTPDLPTYHFNHQHYWLLRDTTAERVPNIPGTLYNAVHHPLLSSSLELAGGLGTVYSGHLTSTTQPSDTDLVELAQHIGALEGVPQLDSLTIERPLPLPSQGPVDIQATLTGADSLGPRALTVHARRTGEPWTLHASGLLAFRPEAAPPGSPAAVPQTDRATSGAVYRVAWEPAVAGDRARDAEDAPDMTVLRLPTCGTDSGDPLGYVHKGLQLILDRIREHITDEETGADVGDRVLVVVVCSGDLAGAAVGGLVRSVQAERPGRVVLVETEGDVEPARSLLIGVVAGGEPHV